MGTGTLAAGIAVGLGNENFECKGIATDSELIVVKLREEVGVYKEGRISYALSDFLAGIKYVIDSLKNHPKSLIINLTVASKSEGVVETTLLESFESLTIPGVIIVCGLGNEGNTDTHYKGNIKNINDVVDILIQVGEQKT
ncbi:S8 family serine peptidase [Paraclostridium bifermentans]|nr:S8 family serine peptidase [Paraclostridium bifermentans]